MKTNHEFKFYLNENNEIVAVDILHDGEEHQTADIRTEQFVISKSTLVKNMKHKIVENKHLEIGYHEMSINLPCSIMEEKAISYTYFSFEPGTFQSVIDIVKKIKSRAKIQLTIEYLDIMVNIGKPSTNRMKDLDHIITWEEAEKLRDYFNDADQSDIWEIKDFLDKTSETASKEMDEAFHLENLQHMLVVIFPDKYTAVY